MPVEIAEITAADEAVPKDLRPAVLDQMDRRILSLLHAIIH